LTVALISQDDSRLIFKQGSAIKLTHHIGLVVSLGAIDDDLVPADIAVIRGSRQRPSRFPAEEAVDDVAPVVPPASCGIVITLGVVEIRDKEDLVSPNR
jgi:hypothetical protein